MRPYDYEVVENIIGYTFKDKRLLLEAFTHSSYANENADISYERLEFLGDSILGFVVSSFLFNRYPNEDEGFLTKAKASIVSGKTLAYVMDEMGLIKYVRTAQGSIQQEVTQSSNVKEDIFESIIGAIMIDSESHQECEKYIYRHLGKRLNGTMLDDEIYDYKSKLLEYVAKHPQLKVQFEVSPLGDNVNSGFSATVLINNEKYGYGEGRTKKKAQQVASKITLQILKK